MSPQLKEYADHYRESQTEAHRVADGLTDEQFNWKPSQKEWSVGECIVHLNTIAKAYLPEFEGAIEAGLPDGQGPYTYGLLARLFTNAVRPGSRPLPTGGPMNPSKGGTVSEVDKARAMASFDSYTGRYITLCESLEGRNYASVKIRSPFLAMLRLPLGAFVDAMGLHAIRHVQQAERVTQRPGFPASRAL